jgi:hypothetical protein
MAETAASIIILLLLVPRSADNDGHWPNDGLIRSEMTNDTAHEAANGASGVADGERERSTILFPYGDIEWAVKVAKGVHHVGGTSCQFDQLAAQLGMAASGGGFRTNLLTSKIFGLVTYGQGTVQLTALGQKACDPRTESAAKADAFLAVPLYRAVYERFRGTVLPPAAALENEMGNLGVARKQTGKARQAFQRSAQQAGFFAFGADRLVMPSGGSGGDQTTTEKKPQGVGQHGGAVVGQQGAGAGSGSGGGGTWHPFIEGLLKTLPAADTEWKADGRRKWLQAAANVFDLIYTDQDEGKTVVITVKSSLDTSAK